MLVSVKITQITLKIIFSKAFSRNIINVYLKKKKLFFFTVYKNEKSKAWQMQKNIRQHN